MSVPLREIRFVDVNGVRLRVAVSGISSAGPPLLIITGLGDRLAPPEQAELLWEHWDRCAFHWFPGNHILHVSQPDYLRRMTRFMRDFMFV